MSAVPKGPGQQEVTGDLKDPRVPEPVGTYKDPESGAELTVTMGAGADALVRMGWVLKEDFKSQATAKKAQAAQDKADAEKQQALTDGQAKLEADRLAFEAERQKFVDDQAKATTLAPTS